MPHLFVVLPEVKMSKLTDPKASMFAKGMNFVKRLKERVVDEVIWERSRLMFVCPVTLQIMPCGPDDKGYLIQVPTAFVRAAVPVLIVGLKLLKFALATQGLGCCIPNLADMIPADFMNADVIGELLTKMSEDIKEDAPDRALSADGYRGHIQSP